MSAAGLTHSQVAVMLIDGALAHIAGNVQGKMPFSPVHVHELDRAGVGLKPGGQTLQYQIGEDGVFIDLNGSEVMVWFVGADFDRALSAADAALKRVRAKQVSDEALETPKQRRRIYQVDFSGGRLAIVSIEYAERGAQRQRFRAHISALARK
ncbi:MAG: hypothetical protein ACK4X1_05180 [Terricaulis sp.]